MIVNAGFTRRINRYLPIGEAESGITDGEITIQAATSEVKMAVNGCGLVQNGTRCLLNSLINDLNSKIEVEIRQDTQIHVQWV